MDPPRVFAGVQMRRYSGDNRFPGEVSTDAVCPDRFLMITAVSCLEDVLRPYTSHSRRVHTAQKRDASGCPTRFVSGVIHVSQKVITVPVVASVTVSEIVLM